MPNSLVLPTPVGHMLWRFVLSLGPQRSTTPTGSSSLVAHEAPSRRSAGAIDVLEGDNDRRAEQLAAVASDAPRAASLLRPTVSKRAQRSTCTILLADWKAFDIPDTAAAAIKSELRLFAPVVEALGFDLIWFGILVVVATEISLITPPIGLNVFVLKGVLKDVPVSTIFKGVTPFWVADIFRLILLALVPGIALLLPSFMS